MNLSKKQKCLIQRNGVQIWMDEEKANQLQAILQQITEHKFINFDGRTINTADCTGLYLPEDMENMTKRKNGQWQCHEGTWHDPRQQCNCLNEKQKKDQQEQAEKQYKEKGFKPLMY